MAKHSQQQQLPIVAIIEYRLEIPAHWDSNRFCRLKFKGTDELACEDYYVEWNRIEFEKFFASLEEIKDLQERKAELIQLYNTLYSEYKNSRIWYKRATPEQRELLSAARSTLKKVNEVESQIANIEKDRFIDPAELYQKAKDFLADKGFGLISQSKTGSECTIHSEFWHKIEEF